MDVGGHFPELLLDPAEAAVRRAAQLLGHLLTDLLEAGVQAVRQGLQGGGVVRPLDLAQPAVQLDEAVAEVADGGVGLGLGGLEPTQHPGGDLVGQGGGIGR